MSEEQIDDFEEPAEAELDVVDGEEFSGDEVVPAARKLTTFESSPVGEAEEGMQEGENLTVSAKDAERKVLEEAMKRFLKDGGKIQQVPADTNTSAPTSWSEE